MNLQPNFSDFQDLHTEHVSESAVKFEVKMHNTEMRNAKTATSWFYILYIHSQNQIDSMSPSRLEIKFFLDSSASISVLIIPTWTMIAQMFNFCNQDQHDTSTTLTIANQSEVPIKQYISLTCLSTIGKKTRFFISLFAVVVNKKHPSEPKFCEIH